MTEVHKRNQAGNQGPVCLKVQPQLADTDVIMDDNIDLVTCIYCLRILAKDAVLYGNARRPERKW
jgi:hypothetical protein